MSAFGKEEKFKYAFKFGRCALKLFIHVYARGITITSVPTILRLDLYMYCHCLYPDCFFRPHFQT
jgi:hypothetical protein